MSCLPSSGRCIEKSEGCDGESHCFADTDETLCVRMDTETDDDVLLVHNSVSSAWEQVCRDGWTRQYSDLTCRQLGYQRALTEAYVPANVSAGRKSQIGALRNGSDPARIQSYLTKGKPLCDSGYVVRIVCFQA
ncbi:hypothetical protein EGW08_018573, partial [Elysia chlorotica]